MLRYKRSTNDQELQQILELQRRNLPDSLSDDVQKKEGFVTVSHDFDLLKRMHDKCPHFIVTSDDKVVGYALSMHPDFGNEIEVLIPMFTEINAQLATDEPFIVMGQICIDVNFRKQGIFRALYKEMLNGIRQEYHQIITEVDQRNQRSLQAHLAIGFKPLSVYKSGGRNWELIRLTQDYY